MRNILVVLVSGKSLNGKDSLYLEVGKDFGFHRVSFADKLKKDAMDVFRLTEEQVYGSLKDVEDTRYPNLIDDKYIISGSVKKENPDYKPYMTPRRILQVYGFKMRDIYPTIWADYIFNSELPSKISEGVSRFMITDVRFKNEIKAAEEWSNSIKEGSICKVRIVRPGYQSLSAPDDISEVDLDDYKDWDYIIQNNRTLAYLRYAGRNIFTSIIKEYKPL